MKVPIEHYLVFVIAGLLPWSFLTTSLAAGLESLMGHYHLLSKVALPAHVFALAETLSAFINFLLALPIVVLLALWDGLLPTSAYFAIVPLILLLFLQAYSMAALLGLGFVFFRDLRQVLGIVLQVWFYATPIAYNQNMIPLTQLRLFNLNPVFSFFTAFHAILIQGEWPSWQNMLQLSLWTVILILLANFAILKTRDTLVESM